jgi:cytochrome c oxidase subunit 2
MKVGSYPIACAELCGTGHSLMHATLRVVPKDKFEAELAAGLTALPVDGGPGLALLKSKGCVACHTLNGTKLLGPSYLGIFGRKTKLTDGREIVADEEYLNRAIENPAAEVVEGFTPGLMPKLPLTAEERKAVVEFLKTLR